MLNIQELANFITEKLNIISADNGASYVFDTTFGADLTVMEEAY